MRAIKERQNVVITGANGYLGSHLVKALIKKGYYVWAVVRSKESDTSKIKGLSNCEIVACPLSEIDTLPERIPGQKIQACYHLAWPSGARLRKEAVSSQVLLIGNSINLMNAVAQLGCGRFVGAGTILETNANLPLANHPNMVYAVTKDCTNKLLALKARELGMQYTWCRLCGLYGDNDETGNLVSYTLSRLKQGLSPEYSSGIQPYSFVHVEDCANALLCVGEGPADTPQLLTIAGPECMTIKEYMTIVQKNIAPDVQLKFGVRPDDGVSYTPCMFDNHLLKEMLGFKYSHSFEDEMSNKKKEKP